MCASQRSSEKGRIKREREICATVVLKVLHSAYAHRDSCFLIVQTQKKEAWEPFLWPPHALVQLHSCSGRDRAGKESGEDAPGEEGVRCSQPVPNGTAASPQLPLKWRESSNL